MPSAYVVVALTLAIAACVALVITFPIVTTSLTPSKDFVQRGNVTWDVYSGSALDSVQSTYRLYQTENTYVLELDVLPRDLLVPSVGATSQSWLQIRIHDFSPIVTQVGVLGSWEYLFPLSQHNAASIIPDGPCFDPPTPTCVYSGWSGSGGVAPNSITFAVDGLDRMVMFSLQTVDSSAIDWTNYTLSVSRRLYLHMPSA
jgi:hypothetical protein